MYLTAHPLGGVCSRPQRLAKVWGDALNPWFLCTILSAQSLRTSGRLHSEAPDEDPTVDRGLPGAGPSPRHTGVPGPVKATWGVSPRAATSRRADNKRDVSRQGLGLGATGTTNRSGTGMGTGSLTARVARHGSALELQGGQLFQQLPVIVEENEMCSQIVKGGSGWTRKHLTLIKFICPLHACCLTFFPLWCVT
jgi:hypothetical protein